jgi:1-phosphatidylinositol phosphodiesterase
MRSTLALAVIAGCAETPQLEPDWMAGLDDGHSLAELSIPGTHDTGALHEPYPGVAMTQELAIADQLEAGVRYLDLRCRNFDDQFLIYHGAIDQDQTFDEVLATIDAFLDAHPGETVIASVKEELAASGATLTFEQLFQAYVAREPARWYLGAAVPRLGDVRGQIVLLRRFDATGVPLGLDATAWPDDATFTIANADATLRIEDEYMVSDDAAKWTAIAGLVAEARTGDPATLYLTYTSGYQLIGGLPDIPSVATDIDARLDTYLADPANAHGRLGVLVMDFVTAARARAIVATNQLTR